MDREIYNIILVHTARTWERVRITQPHQEMPFDNIGSIDEIEEIASTIYNNDIIQGFCGHIGLTDSYWIDNVEDGMSDVYIENEAERIIRKEYLKESKFLCGSCGEECSEYTYSEDRDVDECNECKTSNDER